MGILKTCNTKKANISHRNKTGQITGHNRTVQGLSVSSYFADILKYVETHLNRNVATDLESARRLRNTYLGQNYYAFYVFKCIKYT